MCIPYLHTFTVIVVSPSQVITCSHSQHANKLRFGGHSNTSSWHNKNCHLSEEQGWTVNHLIFVRLNLADFVKGPCFVPVMNDQVWIFLWLWCSSAPCDKGELKLSGSFIYQPAPPPHVSPNGITTLPTSFVGHRHSGAWLWLSVNECTLFLPMSLKFRYQDFIFMDSKV